MVRVGESVQGCYETQDAPFGEVHERSSGRVVLGCACRAKLILIEQAAIPRSQCNHLECGVCGEKFVLARMGERRNQATVRLQKARSSENERCYSWLEDYLERLEGKETRHEY